MASTIRHIPTARGRFLDALRSTLGTYACHCGLVWQASEFRHINQEHRNLDVPQYSMTANQRQAGNINNITPYSHQPSRGNLVIHGEKSTPNNTGATLSNGSMNMRNCHCT